MQKKFSNKFKPKKYNGDAKKRRKKNKSQQITLLSVFILVIVIIISFLIKGLIKNGKSDTVNSNPLIGTWVYDEYTKYIFDNSGNGELQLDDVAYKYTYKIEDDKLIMDFEKSFIRDCDYTFTVDGKKLTLKGGNGTDGKTYNLKKQ